jgi:hypothetical protein
MFHRSCRYAFLIIGALLLLLALVLALNIEFDTAQAQAYQIQRGHVVQAVSRLENGCLACHELVNANPSGERVYTLFESSDPGPNYQSTIISELTATAPLLQNQLHTQLIETGQRILNLPDVQDQRVETVMEDYLHVYAQASADPGEQTTQWALWQLDDLEILLRVLENQASPYQLVRQENQPTPFNLAALHTLTTAPNVAAMVHYVSLRNVVQVIATRPESALHAMPTEIVYATHRRGPPVGAYLDSVL